MSAGAGGGNGPAPGGWLHVSSDGASRGNPGPAGAGGLARDDTGRVLLEVSEFLGEATNNEAEYLALVRVLEESEGLGYARVKIYLDSELVVNQLKGGYRVRSRRLIPLLSRVKELLDRYDSVEVEHVPRERNRKSDALANRAVDGWLASGGGPLEGRGDGSLF